MSVRAKFIVTKKSASAYQPGGGTLQEIHLMPVFSGSEENKQFFAATPSGSITLGTVNAAAADQFKEGQSYYVDFTAAAADGGEQSLGGKTRPVTDEEIANAHDAKK